MTDRDIHRRRLVRALFRDNRRRAAWPLDSVKSLITVLGLDPTE
jgi:hypothetical protein